MPITDHLISWTYGATNSENMTIAKPMIEWEIFITKSQQNEYSSTYRIKPQRMVYASIQIML